MRTDRRSGRGRSTVVAIAAVIVFASALRAQAPIADNSFFVEEAYNQERRVVQHISALTRASDGAWEYSFTQEWPFFSPAHQVSFTVPVLEGLGGEARLCDVLLNYRYQLVGGEGPVAVSPRLSLLLPTGSAANGAGADALGLQVNLPVSVRAGRRFALHGNAGATHVPRAAAPTGERAAVTELALGGSVIWLAASRFNVLLETVWSRGSEVVGSDATARTEEMLVVPGIRWAHDFASGLQIVPGLGYAVGVGPSRGQEAVIVYLSFEHGF